MKKIFVLLFGILLVLSMSICFATQLFSDVPETHWAYQAIQILKNYEIINGYPDGTFKPNASISRAEFAKIIVNILNIDTSKGKDVTYSDVTQNHWAYQYAKAMGPLLLNGDTKFLPDEPITREEVATVIIKAVEWENKEYNAKTIEKFTDKDLISGDSLKYIAIATENRLMDGNADGTFNPKGKLTRAEVAKLVYNIYINFRHLHFEQYDVKENANPEISIPEDIQNNSSANYSNEVEYTKDGQTYVKRIGKIKDETYEVEYARTNANHTEPSIDVVLNNQLLADGSTHVLNSDSKIYVFINHAYTTNNIYYMFSYGKTTQMKRVSNSVAIIAVSNDVPAGKVRLIIEGTSSSGINYATSTQAFNFSYTKAPTVVEEDVITRPSQDFIGKDNSYSNIKKDLNFIVVFNSDTMENQSTLTNAKADQKIIVRGKPVSNILGIRYRWDNGTIEYLESATGTIDIPKTFQQNSKHQLDIVVLGKDGSVSEQKTYYVEISPAY